MSAHLRIRNGQPTTWQYAFKHAGELYRGGGFPTKADAESAERKRRAALRAGVDEQVKALLHPRSVTGATVGEVIDHYLKAPPAPRRANLRTRAANIARLRDFLRQAGHAAPDAVRLDELTDKLVFDFKQRILTAAAGADESRRLQIYRSANSTLRQARSVLSRDMSEHYTHVGLELPNLDKFRRAPMFGGCRKEEYFPPADGVVTQTFEALARLEDTDVNLFRACWLALGFGLRASEIRQAKISWFVTLDGALWCAGDTLAKNHRFARVRGQLGVADALRTHLAQRPSGDYVLHGTLTERCDDVFRRCSAWMRSLGWNTQHHVHELRAWAGCHLAMHSARGLYAAQEFLRHASLTTTESHYAHHIRRAGEDVSLHLPRHCPRYIKNVCQEVFLKQRAEQLATLECRESARSEKCVW